MRRKFGLYSVLSAVLLLLAITATGARAATLFSDDFEDDEAF